MLLQRRETLNRKFGAWQTVALMIVVVTMILSPIFYGFYQLVRKVQTFHQENRAQEALWWETQEEEGEGLLPVYEEEQPREFLDDTEEKDERISEKLLDDTETKGSSSEEKPLPPTPPNSSDASEK